VYIHDGELVVSFHDLPLLRLVLSVEFGYNDLLVLQLESDYVSWNVSGKPDGHNIGVNSRPGCVVMIQ
jgi:hypothetical protein